MWLLCSVMNVWFLPSLLLSVVGVVWLRGVRRSVVVVAGQTISRQRVMAIYTALSLILCTVTGSTTFLLSTLVALTRQSHHQLICPFHCLCVCVSVCDADVRVCVLCRVVLCAGQ
jgi:hypothetical protein